MTSHWPLNFMECEESSRLFAGRDKFSYHRSSLHRYVSTLSENLHATMPPHYLSSREHKCLMLLSYPLVTKTDGLQQGQRYPS
jgi:hypothetical protein